MGAPKCLGLIFAYSCLFAQVEQRIQDQEDQLSSEDEEMMFYDAEKLDEAYRVYMEATSAGEDVRGAAVRLTTLSNLT